MMMHTSRMMSKEKSEPWRNINNFSLQIWNTIAIKLKSLTKSEPSPLNFFLSGISAMVGDKISATIGLKKEYRENAIKIADVTLNSIAKYFPTSAEHRCQVILKGLEELLNIYIKNSNNTSPIIREAFKEFLGIDDAFFEQDIDKAKIEFNALRKRIFNHHSITEPLKFVYKNTEGFTKHFLVTEEKAEDFVLVTELPEKTFHSLKPMLTRATP